MMAARSIPAPRFNRIVQLQRAEITRDSTFGSEVETWVDVAEVWASVNQTGTSEKFENDAHRAIAKRSAQITIRWRPGVLETMRVLFGGLIWDIEGIAESGRREGLKLFCQTDVSRPAPDPAPGRVERDVEDKTEPEPVKPDEAPKRT